ncbi:tripartite tricarboxylate transporter substrate binding protein [Nocardioides zeae]|uniref:Tripartite tricarboxylate transporter substrate binding protein n=1 Tax=Nocardioides imazamoxiresistens TaxID=3231893 RepID=A0ABU3Q1K6_9ACTN|nr:tripartite tricarboxylate transporter substrate binding protein [Nocardioides zeae]MDT9595336.1 tripartite tricarboxylate transporter substrate binding protein [Nocardioides zeae]
MSPHLVRRSLVAVSATTTLALALGACASRGGGGGDDGDFPSGTITFFTPTAAGGATDLTARTLGAELEDELGVSVVVENRPGAAGSVGMEHVAGLDADGYSIAVFPVEVSMLQYQGFDVVPDDYDFVGQVNSQPGTIAVPADSPYETLADLVEAAESDPGSVSVSTAGAGSIWDAGVTALAQATDVELQAVPFDGGAPAVTAAIGGQVDAVVAGIGETAPAHEDGRLRVLAVFTDEPAPALEDVPTATSEGIDVVIGSWAVIAAPTGLPDDVRDALEEAVATAVEAPDYVELIESGGNIVTYRDAEESAEFVSQESDRFAELFG